MLFTHNDESQSSETKLSHKKYRLLLKKKKRQLKRQCLAQRRDQEIEEELRKLASSPSYQYRKEQEEVEQRIQEEYDEQERRRLHYLWLQREEEAMLMFKKYKEHEERIKAQKEEEARKAREDLEKLQRKETDEKKSKEGNQPWHNPIAPARPEVTDTREICHFYSKTGACRFGERCSRQHLRAESGRTLILRGMFTHFCMEEMFHDEYDTDIGLEFEESEMYQYFLDFYEDVLPEFKRIGKVVQFKVCCNQEPHLRGNVYVQYEKESEAEQAIKVFNGRFYGGKQLPCEYTCVTTWKKAICGLFVHKRCPKGRTCNFLHVFKNPRGEFKDADQDFMERANDRTRIAGSFRNGSRSSKRTPGSQRISRRSQSRTRSYSSSRRSRSRTPDSSPHARTSFHSNLRRSHLRSSLNNSSRRSRSRTPPNRSCRRSHSRSPTKSSSRRSRSRTPPHTRSRRLKSQSPSQRSSRRSNSRSPPRRTTKGYSRSLQSPPLKRSNTEKTHYKKKKSRRKSPSSPDEEWVEKSTVS